MALACAAGGAIAGIAGAAASPSSSATHPQGKSPARPLWGPRRAGLARGGRVVHAQAVVLNRAGTAFITVTEDSGTVQSVSGRQLTIKEGVGNLTYRTVTLTLPSGATVERNFQTSTLSALRKGDRVQVAQSSEGTSVFADDGTLPPRGGHWFGRNGTAPAPPAGAGDGPGAPAAVGGAAPPAA